MQIKIARPEQVMEFKEFVLPEVIRDISFKRFRFYVAIEEHVLCGILVLDPLQVDPEIKSICVSSAYEGRGIATLLLRYATYDYMSGITMGSNPGHMLASFMADADNEAAIMRVFEKSGFTLLEKGAYYRATLRDAMAHKTAMLESVKARMELGAFVSLKNARPAMARNYLRQLTESGIFRVTDVRALEEDITCFGIKNDQITSCILFKLEDDGTIYNQFVYRDPKLSAMQDVGFLFAASLLGAVDKYDKDTPIVFLAINEESEKLLKKTIKGAKKTETCLMYELDLSSLEV